MSCAHADPAGELALERAERGVFSREQAALWVGSRGPRLNALLKRAVASREGWRVHRGLYCLANRYTRGRVNPLELAQRIHGPSYISLETALSHHGFIPEAIHGVTSITLGRVDHESLAALTGELFDEVMSVYWPGCVSRFLAGLRKDLEL